MKKSIKSGNNPIKFSCIPLDAPSSGLSSDMLHVQVGLEMVD
jgi:hypothetical protein